MIAAVEPTDAKPPTSKWQSFGKMLKDYQVFISVAALLVTGGKLVGSIQSDISSIKATVEERHRKDDSQDKTIDALAEKEQKDYIELLKLCKDGQLTNAVIAKSLENTVETVRALVRAKVGQ